MDGVTASPYISYPAPPPPPYGDPRKRRILLAVAAAWGLVLATTGIWYSLHGRHTARDQTTIAQAQPTVDQAITAVVRAATSEGTGEAWVCQAGREPLRYEFRGVPGPRTAGKEGMAPPDFRA